MAELIETVWSFMNDDIDFSVAGIDLSVSLWEIFMASTIIYILVCFARYCTGSEGQI